MSQHRIRLGDLILSDGTDPHAAGGDYTFAVYGENFTTGQPESIDVTIATLLQDGARVVTQGYGNREVAFRVEIGGTDSASLARGEAALAAQMGIRNELGITPFDGWAPESVFDVETSSFGHDFDDLEDVQRGVHKYSLRLVCQPFARSAVLATVAALTVPTTPVVTTINAGSSTTGWSALSGTLSDQGSFLRIGTTSDARWRYTAAIDLSTTRYISLMIKGTTPLTAVGLAVDSTPATLVSKAAESGYTRFVWETNLTAAASLTFSAPPVGAPQSVDFYLLRKSNSPSFLSTPMQTQRSVSVAGSARTQGSLALHATTGTLSSTLVYTTTDPAAGSPALRPYRVSGGGSPAPSASAVSGFTETLGSTVFEVPVANIARGKHQLVVRLNAPSTTPITVTWSARIKTSAGLVGPATTGSTTVTPAAAGFAVFVIDNINLPSVEVPAGSPASVSLTLGGGGVFDDGWLFNLDVGALTWVEAGSSTWLWIETPNLDRPTPAIYFGTSADKSDAWGAYLAVRSWGVHTFKGETSVFMVTAGSGAVESSFTFYPRYFNFVPGN